MTDKRKTAPAVDRVMVMASAGFKHKESGRYVRAGETCEVSAQEAADLAALNMAHPLRPAGFVPGNARARG